MAAFQGYDYNPSTGTYIRNPNTPYVPPLPPKPDDWVKETQGLTELEAGSEPESSKVSRLSLEESRSQRRIYPPRKRKIRILSLDGGGIRGYSSLVILQELMHQVYVNENRGKAPKSPSDLPRPCDFFDLIGGNGTGGLIALMLGRMRMDIESCKNYYVSLTRFVFITDKTLLGMPYGKTLFKASRLEEAIKHCVRESTQFENQKIVPRSPPPITRQSPDVSGHRRHHSWSRRRSADDGSPETSRSRRRSPGNPDALLLDRRDGSCKTFVTAMLEGSAKGAPPVLLRSYPSPAESNPSFRTTIWQAGRATCATASAFKPITIDQVTYLDEGTGMYNPAFHVLDEARQYEFPDCDIGVFVSIGTGKRLNLPSSAQTDKKREWWEGVAFEDFAEAKRRLLRRLDDCEHVHRELVDGVDGGRPRLAKCGVATEDYYRFNVEVGVGEFGMNEWNRLAEVSTGTRRYLGMREVSRLVKECAAKLVVIEKGSIDDGSKVIFHPSYTSSNHTEETPNLQNHPYFLNQQKLRQRDRQQQSENPPDWRFDQSQEYEQQYHQLHQNVNEQPVEPLENITQGPPEHEAVMPDENMYTAPPIPPKILKPTKIGKVVLAAHNTETNSRNGSATADTPNPEIRVTSPTTVAGDSDDEADDNLNQRHSKRKSKRRSSRSRSRGRGVSLPGVIE